MDRGIMFPILVAALVTTTAGMSPAITDAPTADQKQQIVRLDGTKIPFDRAADFADAELKSDNVMGAQIAVLNHGRVVWMHAYGLRDAEHQLPMTVDTNEWAASITKSVFATWVMLQVERGRIDLDEPIAKMLDHPLSAYEPYRQSAADLVKDPRWQRVTPRMLLSHSSGLSNIVAITEPDKKLRLHFEPGTRFAYSGEGFNLLQFVLEQKFSESIDAMMQRDIFVPLAATHTGLVWHDTFAGNVAFCYDANGKYNGSVHRSTARAAGSMTTSVRDLGRFTEALLANNILNAATQAQMLKPQIQINTAHQFPTLDETTSDEGPKVGLAYGVGWGLLTRTRYGPAFFKEGHGDGAENYLICFTRTGTCMIILTNSDNGELAFRPLLEKLIGDTETPWEWEGYTRDEILHNPEHAASPIPSAVKYRGF
jgi:CubicO group peptidase (beta-lactamase class C family)